MREILDISKALSDEQRVRVLMMLTGGEMCVCQITEMLGLAPSTVSKHMSILYSARLVEMRKDGRWVHYRLAGKEAPWAVVKALAWLKKSLEGDPQVASDSKRLKMVCQMDKQKLCRKQMRSA